jgi:hypothetical protein
MNIQECLFCKKLFNIDSLIKNQSKKKFCTKEHQQEFWRLKRNITGDFSRKKKNFKAISLKNNLLTNRELQVCIGGLLGDSNLNTRNNGSVRINFAMVQTN